ncbi:hypothetical protein HU200_037487 [Digitaria exilis]|uniref:Uncharacterized protein n=1 Tax=Digitaria exilis TaxID=1010633 RepID=A0A835EL63_9POAL|nr:hypothetical protein HU200_037487 [Digitaria exilis]
MTHAFFLVESAGRLMLVLRHFHFENPVEGYQPCLFALFEVDTVGHHQELTPQ